MTSDGDVQMDLPNALSGLIELRVRRSTDKRQSQAQSENEDEVIAFCDTLLQSLSALRFVPSAALLQQILLFGRLCSSQRVAMATVDMLLTSCRAIGVPRWRMCSVASAGSNDVVWDILCFSLAVFAKSTNELGTPTRTSATSRRATRRGGGPATNGGRARPRRGGSSLAMSSSSVHRRKLSDESSGEFEEDNVGDDLADDDIDFVTSSERDRLLELLRFFATLFEMERTTPAAAEGRPSLAHLLLLREHDGDDEAANVGLTRAEKRHVTRVEKLATLLVRCFRCLEYLPHSNDSSGDDPDLLTPASARLVSYTQQMFHALNALVDDDDELRPVVSHAALTAFNFLPTIHTRVLFVESLRHRAQKLRWLDTMVTNNFLATGIQNKNRVRMEAPTVRKFVLVYMHLKYSKKDETAALRSLDLYVLLLMHIAHELVHVVRDDRARGVPSTVLQPIESYGTVHMGTSSNGSNGSNSGVVGSEEKVWLADLRSEILQQTEEERPNMTDAALFRLQLLEHALDELALAQSLQQ